MIRERSEFDAIASEIHASGQPIALDLETYGTSEVRRSERVKPLIRGVVRSGCCPCSFPTVFLG
jgi:hypothetical protein